MMPRRRSLFFLVLCIFTLQGLWAFGTEKTAPPKGEKEAAPEQLPYLELFADEPRVFAPLLADPREAKIQMGFMRDRHGDAFWDLSFGGDVGVLYGKINGQEEISLTVRGLVAARFEFGSKSFDLQNSDFQGGAALGYRKDQHFAEVLLYHQSSHLGDEVLERGDRVRIDYSRETLRGLWSYFPLKNLRLYGGISFHLRALPKKLQHKIILQGGSEFRFSLGFLQMYGAMDLQCRQENHWETNVSVQIGCDLGNPLKVLKRQRIYLEFFYGFSNMGQFYDQRELYVLFGIGFNF